jgi:hypothetical protein
MADRFAAPSAYNRCMNTPKFEPGDRVENIKNKRIGFVKKLRGEGVYLVSVQGFGEREWPEAEMVKAEEPPNKRNNKFKSNV